MPAKFVDNQIESEDEIELNIDLDMLQVWELSLLVTYSMYYCQSYDSTLGTFSDA